MCNVRAQHLYCVCREIFLGTTVNWNAETGTVEIECPEDVVSDIFRDKTIVDDLMAYLAVFTSNHRRALVYELGLWRIKTKRKTPTIVVIVGVRLG